MIRTRDWVMVGAGAATVAAVLLLGPQREAPVAAAPEPTAPPAVSTPAVAAEVALPAARRPFLGKPRPPVNVRLVTAKGLYAGTPGSITVEVSSTVEIRNVALRFEPGPGLQPTRVGRQRVADAVRGRAPPVEIAVTPLSGGRQRLAGVLEFESAGQWTAIPVLLTVAVDGPVTILPSASKPGRPAELDATGERVQSLPAD
jgi:hypothetical protein